MSIKKINKFKGKKAKISISILVILLIGGAFAATRFFGNNSDETRETENNLPVVNVITAAQYAGESKINLIGTVRAFSEAAITSEASGRVTDVRVSLGQTVSAGQIIATIENASEQAAVLQAEGIYEASLASVDQNSSATSENRLDNKKDEVISVVKKAYTSADNIIRANVDLFIEEPGSRFPEFSKSLSDYFLRQEINKKRQELQSVLTDWDALLNSLTAENISIDDLDQSIANLREIEELLEMISGGSVDFNPTSQKSSAEISAYIASVSGARNTVAGLIVELNQNKESLRSTSSNVTILDAQLKQSLGALRSAQANLEKTIIRTPISGTINNLGIRSGDFISAQRQVAEVANNSALEIVTFVGSSDRELISVGDSFNIEDEFTGIITEIAPGVDSATGKTEVRVASESSDLQNGDTVTLTKVIQGETLVDSPVIVPLSAIKFQIEDGFVFVVENDELVLRPVRLGTIRGGSGEILEGLSLTDEFVSDARGLVEGTKVEIVN